MEGEFGLWHSKLRPLEVVFRLPKNRVVPQRRGSVEHSPRGPFRFRALFYLMLLRIFQNFPFLGTLALIERMVDGWVGIFWFCVYLRPIFLSKCLIFADGIKIWFSISKFDPCESTFGFRETIFGLWEPISTVKVSFLPWRVDFEQLSVEFDPKWVIVGFQESIFASWCWFWAWRGWVLWSKSGVYTSRNRFWPLGVVDF